MADAEPAEPFLIGLAALEVISDAAASSPVLLITDDAQWLDEASCAVLSFVARRLAAESAALGYAVLPEGTARFYHRRDLRYVHVAGLDDIEVALAQHKARPMPEFDRFARIAQRLLGRVA